MPPAHLSGPAGRRDPLPWASGSWELALGLEVPCWADSEAHWRGGALQGCPRRFHGLAAPGSLLEHAPRTAREARGNSNSKNKRLWDLDRHLFLFRGLRRPRHAGPRIPGRQVQASISPLLMEPGWEKQTGEAWFSPWPCDKPGLSCKENKTEKCDDSGLPGWQRGGNYGAALIPGPKSSVDSRKTQLHSSPPLQICPVACDEGTMNHRSIPECSSRKCLDPQATWSLKNTPWVNSLGELGPIVFKTKVLLWLSKDRFSSAFCWWWGWHLSSISAIWIYFLTIFFLS